MFGEEIKFKYKWRTYQAKVLSDIEKHLNDNKLHIIAPPGSGKTVLGLEVVRRLNKKTLILSPTITIRNQWVDRFGDLFSNNTFKDYSLSLKEPRFMTSSTYQSLHSAFTGKNISDSDSDDITEGGDIGSPVKFDLIKTLQDSQIEVLVLDEAHHLKTEWWKSIMKLIRGLEKITIVSLTATPPYDSTAQEWERYLALCGPVDAEISVPELIREKNLCPHQDLIYFSEPSEEEKGSINQFYGKINEILNRIVENKAFERILTEHPVIQAPDNFDDTIYNDVEYYASLVIFLHDRGNHSYDKLRKKLGLDDKQIPPLNGEWLESLLSFALFKDIYLRDLDEIRMIKKELKEFSAIENKRVVFTRRQRFNKLLSSSISKFRSIRDIVDHEYHVLGEDLCLVILSDYVRKETLTSKSKIDKFGVVPIFKYLKESFDKENNHLSSKMAVLSGSICIIPDFSIPSFIEKALLQGLSEGDVIFNSLGPHEGYSELILPSSKKNLTVGIITELLSEGSLNIIIGTKSLLGEGWDCQAINSLIMATFVGSYMLSNQIRGRAIRINREKPQKTSNIWHLMCLDRVNKGNNYDYDLLTQRFKCFTGLDSRENIITNGIERLQLENFEFNKLSIDDLNNQMKCQSNNRIDLYDRWFESINKYKLGKIVKEVKTEKKYIDRKFVFYNTIKYLILQGLAGSFIFAIDLYTSALKSLARNSSFSLGNIGSVSIVIFAVFIIGTIPPTIKSLLLLFKHGSVARSFRQIGLTVFDTMKHLNMFENTEKISVQTSSDSSGAITCMIKNCSSYEQSIFLSAIQEIVSQIGTPRYLITREQKLLVKTLDYHSVPAIFGVKKEKAEIFHKYWKKNMGHSKLYYTRNSIGRKKLVKARSRSLSSGFIERSEITDSWKD